MSNKPALEHVAIIMDGNGRWAKKRNLPRTAGHRQGIKATQAIIEACVQHEIKYLTLFAFSSENWNRPKSEISVLMDLFVESLQSEVDTLNKKGVCLRFLGHLPAFSNGLSKHVQQAEELTRTNSELVLSIAMGYGGRWDILQAVEHIVADVLDKRLAAEDIDEVLLENRLVTAGIPAPDLFIRTGGEKRISNFLLWQLAYTELYFSDVLWPDFNPHELEKAFENYRVRQRRFGLIQEQLV